MDYLIWPRLTLFLVFVALTITAPALSGRGRYTLLGLEEVHQSAVRPIALLAGLRAAQIYFAGFLSTRLKTALATPFARETFFKFGYLALGLALGNGLDWRTPVPARAIRWAVRSRPRLARRTKFGQPVQGCGSPGFGT